MEQKNIKKENKNELEELRNKSEEYLAGWKRERADFINYKKEEAERVSNLIKFANEDLIFKILPVLDNLLLAQTHINDDGLMQVIKQFEDFLKQEGIEQIKVLDKKFDPNLMEAIEGEGENVSEEILRGYTMHGKLIRPAKVKIIK
jgi:molecular chaperone GrpE